MPVDGAGRSKHQTLDAALAADFQHLGGSQHVDGGVGLGLLERPANSRPGGQVNDRIGLEGGKNRAQLFTVANVDGEELELAALPCSSRLARLITPDSTRPGYRPAPGFAFPEQALGQVRPDEPGASGNENVVHRRSCHGHPGHAPSPGRIPVAPNRTYGFFRTA